MVRALMCVRAHVRVSLYGYLRLLRVLECGVRRGCVDQGEWPGQMNLHEYLV
jgi:hypothetical protein